MNNTTKQQNIIYNVFKTIRKSIINELIIDKNTIKLFIVFGWRKETNNYKKTRIQENI